MDPALLNILLPMLQGGNLNGMFGGQGMSGMLSELKNYSEQEQGAKASRLNVDPLRDIAPFRVNPFRGFMAKNGGSIDASSFEGGLPMNTQFQMPSLGMLPAGGIMGSIRNQIQQSAFQAMQLGGTPEPDPSKLFKGSGDAYDVLIRYGLIPSDTSREMFTQMYKPEDVKRIIMESKYAPKPGGTVIARRPITIAEEDTQLIETQIPQDTFDQAYAKARKKGLKTFEWEGMTYNTDNDPNAKATSGKSASTTKTEIIKTRKEGNLRDFADGGTVDPGNPKPMAIDNTATKVPIDPNAFRNVALEAFNSKLESEPEMVELKDRRKVRATTGNKINPNKDLVTGKYSKNIIESIIHKAKAQGVDPTTALAVALQETGLDNTMEGNVGHTIGKQDVFMGQDDVDNFISVLKDKTGRYSDKLGISKDDEAMRLQAYNGFGKVVPSTESDYHGFNMKKIYGVPIPKEGLNMKKNPLYGKQILDLRDNVIKKNKSVMDIINKIEKSYKFLPSAQEPIKAIQGAKMGGAAGSLPSIPASIQLDTINNVPSNLPGGSGGKYDLSQLALQENERFMIPKMQPFTNPSFGNNMFDIQRQFQPNGFFQLGGHVVNSDEIEVLIVEDNDFTRSYLQSVPKFKDGGSVNGDLVYIPVQFSNGGPVEIYGVDKASIGGFFKSIGKGIGKVAKGAFNAVKDLTLFGVDNITNLAGVDLIKDGAYHYDLSKKISGATGKVMNVAGMVAAPFVPGGTLIRGIGAGANMLLNGRGIGDGGGQQPQAGIQQGQYPQGQYPQGIPYSGGSMYNLINPFGQPPTAGMFQGQFSGGPGPFGGLYGNMGQQSGMQNLGGMGSLMGMFGGFGTPMGGMQNLGGMGNALGQVPFGTGFGTPMTGGQNIPAQQNQQGQNPQLQSLMNLLQRGLVLGKRQYGGSAIGAYAEGGEVQEQVELIPIQTEKVGKQSEMIIHLDGTITKVNATKRHKQMDKDEVTDIVPSGSYITSADPMMKIKFKTAEDIVLGIKSQPYKEWKKGTVPTEITLAEIWGSGKKDKTPAELTQNVAKKFNIIDKDPYYDFGGDIFTKRTNQENMEARIPFLSEIVRLNEENKSSKQRSAVGTYRYGGSPLKLPGIQHAPWGDIAKWVGENPEVIASALPAITSLFGGNKGQQGVAGISPEVQAGILGSIPMYQAGLNQNIAAQQGALGQGIQDYSALGNQLINFARQSSLVQNQSNMLNTGLGMANYAAMETNLPQLDLSAARSRINNYQPRSASRAALEAQSTPNFDASAIMSQMGARSGPLLAQLMSDQQRTANTAAIQRNQTLDSADMMKMEQLNKLDLTEQPFNINQQEKERALREQQRSGMFGTAQSGIQRTADIQSGLLGQYGNIQSQILPTLTQFNMQRAGLEGQQGMMGAQNAMNAFSVLGGMQSQNALANSMKQQQGTGVAAGTGLPFQGTIPGGYGSGVGPGGSNTGPTVPWSTGCVDGFKTWISANGEEHKVPC